MTSSEGQEAEAIDAREDSSMPPNGEDTAPGATILVSGSAPRYMERSANRAGTRSLALLLAVIISIACSTGNSQTAQPYSSSTEYTSMLKELHNDPVRPSQMGTGTLSRPSQVPVHFAAQESPQALRLETRAWRLEITKPRWGLAVTNKQTGLTWQWIEGDDTSNGMAGSDGFDRKAMLHLTRVLSIVRVGDEFDIRVAVAGSSRSATLKLSIPVSNVIRLSMQMQGSEANSALSLNFKGTGPFFGLGERFDRVKLDGLTTVLRPEDLLGKPGHNWTYIPVPFLFTPRGLGIYLDTAAVSAFDLSGSQQEAFSIKVNEPSVDAYFFVGKPKDVLEEYTSLVGRTPISPPWAFGVWVCSYQGPEKVLQEARRLRQEKIPASAIWTFDVMDKGDIMGWPLWWTGYYPHPRQLTDELHKLGFKSLTYIHPYIRSVLDPYNLPSPAFEEGKRNGMFVLDAAGEPTGPAFEPYKDGNIDFTRPSNVDWWEHRIQDILLKDNFDGWMEDYGEWVNDADRFAANVSGQAMANLNPLFYHRITYEIARRAKPDVVEFVRSGYSGSQGYTRVVWGGDQFPNWSQDYGLPSVVRAGITAGLSGFSVWGPDIAANGHSRELWTRWVEFGALTPIMRNHPWDKPEGAMDLWHDPETIDTFKRYAGLHVSLFPYFYTYAHEAAKTGLPIMRHLMLDFPSDPNTYDCSDEYLLGDRILVAPVIQQGSTSRSVYLPQGSWTDYWTGAVLQGGRQVTIPAPLAHIPILVRAGSILPLIRSDTQTLAQDLAADRYSTLTNDLTWQVFSSSAPAQSSFQLYDGTVASSTENQAEIEVRVEHSTKPRRYQIILPADQSPHQVLLAGKPVPEIPNTRMSEANDNPTGWRLHREDQTLRVLFEAADFDLHIRR